LNIIFICDEYPPGKNGGIGTAVRVLGRELVKQGHGVYVVGLYPYSYGEKDFEMDEGVQVWRLRYGINLASGNNFFYKVISKLPGFVRSRLNGRKAFDNYIAFINKLVATENIDLIEIADWNTFVFKIGFSVIWPPFKAPLLLKSHGCYTKIFHDLQLPVDPEFSKTDRLLFNRADALAAVSYDTATKNRDIFHIKKKIKVLYNGIEIPVKNAGARENKKIIYTGALTIQKGVLQLMKAWNIVHEKHPDAKLLVFGKGKMSPMLKLLSKSAAPTVYFKGHVSRGILFDELSIATMAVFPSYTESFSMAPLEAMSVGCPVIYTERSSGKELITDHENGRLDDPDRDEKIANVIIHIIENKKDQLNFSSKGYLTIINNFTIAKIAKEHVEYYLLITAKFKSKTT